MHITSFHIDAFGKLNNVGVRDLAPGLSIFLGNNEAGKSTCLEFFRTMLTGYGSHKKDIFTPLAPAEQKAGGSLDLQTKDHGLIRLTRRPGKGQGLLWLHDAHGEVLENALLDKILSGVTRDVYRNVFGFSLSELQILESLSSDEVRHALYGASFGMHLRSPSTVLKELTAQMEKRFKNRGTTPTLNVAIKTWEDIQKQLRLAQSQCAQFDSISLKKNTLESDLVDLRQEKHSLEQQRRQTERQLGVWKQWDEWRNTEQRLQRLDPIEESFPQDGPARLEKATHLALEAKRRIQTQEDRCKKIQEILAHLPVHQDLIQKRPELQSLSERKTSFRQAQSALAPLSARIERNKTLLQERLRDLGPQWNCARIHSMDRSLFIRSELEKCASQIQATEGAYTTASSGLEKANANVEAALHAVEIAQTALDAIAQPDHVPAHEEREDIRRSLALMENAQISLQEKELSLRQARQTLFRTLTPLHIQQNTDNDTQFSKGTTTKHDVLAKLEGLTQARTQGLALANDAMEARKYTHEAELCVRKAQEEEDTLRARIDRIRKHKLEAAPASPKHLDTRAQAVRTLRHLQHTLALEQERLKDMMERHAQAIAPAPVKSVPLMIIGIIIVTAGLGGLILPIYFNIHELQISAKHVLPLSQLTSYLVVVAGAAFLAGGLPRSGPETLRFKHEQGVLEERISAVRIRLMELEGRIQEQCVIAETLDANPITLDAVEVLLERERQKCAHDERITLELEQLEKEFTELCSKTHMQRQSFVKAQRTEQEALLKWHDLLHTHHVDVIPSAEGAEAFFARSEAALMAQEALLALLQEMEQLEEQIQTHMKKLLNIKPIVNILSSAQSTRAHEQNTKGSTQQKYNDANLQNEALITADTPQEPCKATPSVQIQDIIFAAQRVLDACKSADEIEATRFKALTALENAQHTRGMARNTQREAATVLQQCTENLSKAHALWKENLQKLGMETDMEPTMLRAALECMEACLAIESEILKLEEEFQRCIHECTALILPLQTLLKELHLPLPNEAQEDFQPNAYPTTTHIAYQENWIAALDVALHAAQEALENKQNHEQYTQQLQTYEEELREAQRAFDDAQHAQAELLRLGKAHNAEQFLRLAAIGKQREEFLQRKADLEDALRLAAGEQDFAMFLQSFTETDQEERQEQLIHLQKALQECVHKEENIVTELAQANTLLHSLSSSNERAELRQQELNIQESFQQEAKEWARYALAKQLILQAKQNFERERQPQVIRLASEIFSAITEQRWQGINASLEDASLHVLPPFGEPVSPNVLSRGTQEQLYLSLRLAYIRNHAEHATPLPIIMDDVLVNFDPHRAQRTASALLHLCQEPRAHQVLFFTCHPHVADMLQKHIEHSNTYIVEDGTIYTI